MTAANAGASQALQEEILADARTQAKRALDHARREAEALLAKAKADVEQERQDRLVAAQADAKRQAALILATVPVEVARKRARRIEDALQAVHDRARAQLAKREGFDYRAVLVWLAAQAVVQMDGNRFILQLGEADLRAFGPALAEDVRRAASREGLEVSVDPTPGRVEGGVVVRDAAGHQVWDQSLVGRLERFWPALRIRIGVETLAVSDAAAGKES